MKKGLKEKRFWTVLPLYSNKNWIFFREGYVTGDYVNSGIIPELGTIPVTLIFEKETKKSTIFFFDFANNMFLEIRVDNKVCFEYFKLFFTDTAFCSRSL